MKILGCFKIVPDLDLIAEEDWKADDQLRVDTGYVKLLWNCFDESALEMMLKLSDLSEGFGVVYELNALTIGKKKHESFLKTLYALGFASGTRVEAEEEINFCPEMIAEGVANYVKNIAGQDVIVMGTQSSDGSNMKTPYLLAEKLGWPCISQVIGAEPVDEEHLKVTNEVPGGHLVQVIKTPCVLAVGNAPCAYLRIPTLKDKMKLGKKPIELFTMEQLGMHEDASHVRLDSLKKVDNKRNTVVIEGDTPQEKAQKLYDLYLKGRLEKL